MNLQECLDKLARGKLSNLAISSNGSIKSAAVPKVLDAINEGIARLYSQFPIKESSVIVELVEGRTEYELSSEHSIRNKVGDPVPDWEYYIRDTDEQPFEDDIQVIYEVWDNWDRKRPLNDPDTYLSVYTPEPNVIAVNSGIKCRVLNILYRAKHKLLTLDNLDENIELPVNLNGALLSYVAYLIHSDMNTEASSIAAQKYFSEYQAVVNEVIQYGSVTPDKLVSDFKFIRRGWV